MSSIKRFTQHVPIKFISMPFLLLTVLSLVGCQQKSTADKSFNLFNDIFKTKSSTADLAFGIFDANLVCNQIIGINDCVGRAIPIGASSTNQVYAVWGDYQWDNRNNHCSEVAKCGTIYIMVNGSLQSFLFNQYGGDTQTFLQWEMPRYMYIDGVSIAAPSIGLRGWGGKGEMSVAVKIGSPKVKVMAGDTVLRLKDDPQYPKYEFNAIEVIHPRKVDPGNAVSGTVRALCGFKEKLTLKESMPCEITRTLETFTITWSDGMVEKYKNVSDIYLVDDLGDRLTISNQNNGKSTILSYENGNKVTINYVN